jgi:hypothetical protein
MEYREAVKCYQHHVEWANRLILGARKKNERLLAPGIFSGMNMPEGWRGTKLPAESGREGRQGGSSELVG